MNLKKTLHLNSFACGFCACAAMYHTSEGSFFFAVILIILSLLNGFLVYLNYLELLRLYDLFRQIYNNADAEEMAKRIIG